MIVLILLGVLAMVCSVLYFSVRFIGQKRLFRSPLVQYFWFTAALVGAIATGILIIGPLENLLDSDLLVALSQFTMAGAFPVFLWLAKLTAPKKIERLPGRRRVINFRLVARFVWAAAIGLVGWIFWKSGLEFWQLQLGILFAAGGLQKAFDYGIRRQSQASVEEKTAADSRPPVLYLRSFAVENEYFWTGNEHEITHETGPVGLPSNGRLALTFPEFFGKTVENSLGPFVGLGNPQDWLPSEGVATTYYQDAGWQQHVERLMDSAAFLFIQVGNSKNLRFELELIVRKGLAPRTVIPIKPRPANGVFDRLDQLFLKMMARETVAWADFSMGMTAAGFTMPAGEPPPGSLVVFDEKNVAEIREINARLPGEFVDAIKNGIRVSSI